MSFSKRQLTATIIILSVLVVLAASLAVWSQIHRTTSEQCVTLAAAGKEVKAIVQVSAPPSTNERSQRPSLVPEEDSTHVIYPVYYGTDRLPSAPLSGLDWWDSLCVFVAWCLAVAAAFLLLPAQFGRAKRLLFVLASVSLIASIVTGCLAIKDRLTIKASPFAAEAFQDGRGELKCGICTVSIPHDHKSGSLEAPSVLSFEFREDSAKHVILQRVQPLGLDDFGKELGLQAESSAWHEALVFVHGYNVSFEDAARRAAQLAHDIRFGGVVAFFSWPSNGHTASYTWDEESCQYAVPHLQEFLELLARNGKLNRIHVIAHSMGNRCLLAALSNQCDFGSCRLDECMFAAPDVDREEFGRKIKQLNATRTLQQKGIGRWTLYASSKDRALVMSQKVHRYLRAGSGGADILLADGLESIDASYLDTDYLGHSYFGANTYLIDDLRQVIEDHLPATERKGMLERAVGSRKYWEFRPVASH